MFLTELCGELKNWFCNRNTDIELDEFTIEDGSLSLPSSLQEGQYYRIVGSVFNDGVHQVGSDEELTDETFDGAIWAMKVPPAVVELAEKIESWISDNQKAIDSPFSSESWGGYSYTRYSNDEAKWQNHFSRELSQWRKA